MADTAKTNIDAMQKSATHVRDVKGQVDSQLSTLLTRLDALSPAWVGGAAVSFGRLKVRWNADTKRLNNALDDIADMLDVTRGNIATTDTAQQDRMTSIDKALNGV